MTDFITRVEGLTHRARVAACIALGREAKAGDVRARAQVGALRSAADPYVRSLGLQAFHGDRDPSAVIAAVCDPSRTLRRRAVKLVALLADDHALEALRHLRDQRARVTCVARLRRQGRQALIDTFLATLDDNDRRRQALAGFASDPLRHLPPEPSPVCWRRLAKRHPLLCLDALQARADEVEVMMLVGPTLAEAAPHATVARVASILARTPEAGRRCEATLLVAVGAAPDEVIAVLLAWRDHFPALVRQDLSGIAWKASLQTLTALAENAPQCLEALTDLPGAARRLSPGQRAAICDGAARAPEPSGIGGLLGLFAPDDPRREAAWQAYWAPWAAYVKQYGGVPHDPLKRLPDDLRHRAARWLYRHLGTDARGGCAELLPASEARELLQGAMNRRRGREYEQAEAWAHCIESTRRDPAGLGELLTAFAKIESPSDRLLMKVFDALVRLPPRAFRDHLPAIERWVDLTVTGEDEDGVLANHVAPLVVRLLPVAPAWAAAQIARLFTVLNYWTAGVAEPFDFPAADNALAPYVTAWTRPAHEDQPETDTKNDRRMMHLASLFAKWLPRLPRLFAGLAKTAQHSQCTSTLKELLPLLRRHAPSAFARLADSLLEDPSTGRLPGVADHLATRRQDLLTLHLRQRIWEEGRFAWFGLSFPDVDGGTGTWTTTQQALREALYHADVPNPKAALPQYDLAGHLAELRALANHLARLAWRPAALRPLAAHPAPAIQGIAVGAFGRIDDGAAALNAVVGALGTEHARFAVHGLRQVLSEVDPEAAMAALAQVPLQQVTVAKEVVRAAGDLGGPAAVRFLLATLKRPKLHRDVRIAAQRGLWSHLEEPEAWAPLEDAARDPDPRVVGSLRRVPARGQKQRARLADLFAVALERGVPETIAELLAALESAPLGSSNLDLALDRGLSTWPLDLVDRAIRLRLAGRSFEGVVTTILALPWPRRQRCVAALLQSVARAKTEAPPSAAALQATCLALVAPLSQRSDGAAQALQCAGATDRADVWLALVQTLARQDAIGLRLLAAASAAEHLVTLAPQLAASEHPALRVLAVAALERRARGARAAELMTALGDLSSDPDPWVRRSARAAVAALGQ